MKWTLCIVLLAGCSSTDSESTDSLQVLFVGNSLTYTNDLPAMVERMAELGSATRLDYRTVAFANFSLEDHWNNGTAREELEDGSWDYVVMQQGPSSLPENQELLKTWVIRLSALAREHGTEPALLTVWPSANRASSFADVIHSYRNAAEAVDGILLPAGEAWLEAWEQDALLELYGPDRFHPSELGTYLAALVVYASLFNESPIGVSASLKLKSGHIVQMSSTTARTLQRAAVRVVQ